MDKDRESSGREDEEIEMEKQLVTNDEHKEDELQEEEEEEVAMDDYSQDLTDICKHCSLGKTCLHTTLSLSSLSPVPVIDPIPTERFPEYVRDMLYGEENKLKAEFLVRSPYMVSFHLFMKTCLCKPCKCAACVSFPTSCVGKVMIAIYFCVHRLWQNYLNHPLLWQSYLITKHTTDSTTSILVS